MPSAEIHPSIHPNSIKHDHDEPDFLRHLMTRKANTVRETIAAIRASTDTPELKSPR